MNFYTAIFNNSTIVRLTRYGEGAPTPKGTVMSITFQLDGQEFMALNGGPHFTFLKVFRFLWPATRNRKWMSFGRNYARVEKKDNAVG